MLGMDQNMPAQSRCQPQSQCQTVSSYKRPKLSEINAELTCILCNGYFIDATTISECLHSFCKTCIVKYLQSNKCCPICETQVHGTKPLLSIRSDAILQDIVYKLIPDVFKNEMQRRQIFYGKHPEAMPASAEDGGEVANQRVFYMKNDKISLSLEYGFEDKCDERDAMKRYLLCPAGLSILHLKKFIVRKYGLSTTYKVDVMYLEDILNEDYTLMDVAYIYAWKRSDPLRLFYRISERPIKRLKTSHPLTIESKSGSGSANSDITNNSVSVSQSKLVGAVGSQAASSCTPHTSTSTIIMTGAAPVPTPSALKSHNSSNISNNSGSTAVTSGKGSTATPKHADTSKGTCALNTPQPTAATPQGILKSKSTHMSASGIQTDEPPKKLRKILPNNTSAMTPKPITNTNCVNTTSAAQMPQLTTTTSTSTVNTLRQLRINTDKSKLSNTSGPMAPNLGLSASKKSKADTNCVSDSNDGLESGPERKVSRKSSAFDVRTLIGTKSPTLPCNRHSDVTTGYESKVEKTSNQRNVTKKSQTSKQSKTSARHKVTTNSMSSTQPSMATNSSFVMTSRPPVHSTGSTAPDASGVRVGKSGTNVSPKQLNAKPLKTTQNDISVKTSNDMSNDSSHRMSIKGNVPKSGPQAPADHPQCLSSQLSPTSIRIKLPSFPSLSSLPQSSVSTANKTSKSSSSNNRLPAPTPTPMPSTQTKSKKQSIEMFGTKQLSDTKSTDRGHKPMANSSNPSISKSPTSQGKTKGASINQIVNKIASGVTAKSTSVNVTSTTPSNPLVKTYTSASQLMSSSNQVKSNALNDDKVSTTTKDSGVASQGHRNDSSMKAVSSASNSGNLVIRISTSGRTHCVESLVSPKDKSPHQKSPKLDSKKDLSNGANNNSSKPNASVTAIDTKSRKTSESFDKSFKNESQMKCIINEEEDDDDMDGKLVVDVPNEDSYDNHVINTKSNVGKNAIKSEINEVSVKSRDMSTKLAISISSTTLSANCAVLTSPPPTPTPSPKSESDSTDKPNPSASNGPLDLSMSTKKDGNVKTAPTPMHAIYDIPPPKPKHCVNPAVLDKHRPLFPTAPKQHYHSFKAMGTQSQGMRQSTGSSMQSSSVSSNHNMNASKKNRSICSPNTTTGNNPSNGSRQRSQPHSNHSQSHYNQKNYSVITPDPHRYTQKIVIRNMGSPPAISSHFNFPAHH